MTFAGGFSRLYKSCCLANFFNNKIKIFYVRLMVLYWPRPILYFFFLSLHSSAANVSIWWTFIESFNGKFVEKVFTTRTFVGLLLRRIFVSRKGKSAPRVYFKDENFFFCRHGFAYNQRINWRPISILALSLFVLFFSALLLLLIRPMLWMFDNIICFCSTSVQFYWIVLK